MSKPFSRNYFAKYIIIIFACKLVRTNGYWWNVCPGAQGTSGINRYQYSYFEFKPDFDFIYLHEAPYEYFHVRSHFNDWKYDVNCVGDVDPTKDTYQNETLFGEVYTVTTRYVEVGYICTACDLGFEGRKCGYNPLNWRCSACAVSIPELAAYDRYNQCSWKCLYNGYITEDSERQNDAAYYKCVYCSEFNHVIKHYQRRPESCQSYRPRGNSTYITTTNQDCCELCPKPSEQNLKRCPIGTYYVLQDACSTMYCAPCTNKNEDEDYFLLNGIESADYTLPNSCYVVPKAQICQHGLYPVYTSGYSYICIECEKNQTEYIKAFDIMQTTTQLRYCKRENCLTTCSSMHYNRNCEITANTFETTTMCADCIIQENELSTNEYTQRIFRDAKGACVLRCRNLYFLVSNNTFSTFTEIRCRKCTRNDCGIGEYNKCDGTTASDLTCVPCPSNIKPNIAGSIWNRPQSSIMGTESCRWQCGINYYRSGDFCIPCDTSHLVCDSGFYIQAQCLSIEGTTQAPSCAECFKPENSIFNSPGHTINDNLSCSKQCTDDNRYVANKSICAIRTIVSCPNLGTFFFPRGPEAEHECIQCTKPPTFREETTTFVDVCVHACLPGFYMESTTATCTRCPSGKFKGTSGNQTCSMCPVNTYQKGLDRPQACISVPENAISSDDRSSILCLQGYELNEQPYQITCDICTIQVQDIPLIGLMSNVLFTENSCEFKTATCNAGYQLTWDSASFAPVTIPECTLCALTANVDYESFQTNTCNRATFTCNSGFYRKKTSAALLSCVLCPIQANAKSVSTQYSSRLLYTWNAFNDAVVNTCGNVPTCADHQDEINLACPISNGCNDGFYLHEWFNKTNISKTKMQRCDPCSLRAQDCVAGQTFYLCTGNAQQNSCRNCAQPLSEGQMWTIGAVASACQWSCMVGYYIPQSISTTMCVACTEGFFQPLENNNTIYSCRKCGDGYTSNAKTGGSACTQCEAGKFSNSSTAGCVACNPNFFANITGATTCIECPRDSYSRESGKSSCVNCPHTFPYLHTKTSPCMIPPIAQCHEYPGFYTDNVSNRCERCPEGAYCLNGMPYLCPYTLSHIYSQNTSRFLSDCTSEYNTCVRSSPNTFRKCPNNTGTSHVSPRGHSILWCRPKPGFYGAPGTVAKECPRDHYCTMFTPIACPDHAPFAPPRSFQISHCTQLMYSPCKIGYFLPFNQNVCQPCPEGSYCPGNDIILACDWTSNWYSNPQSTSLADCYNKVQGTITTCPHNTQYIPFTQPTSALRCRAAQGYYFVPGYHAQAHICPENYFCTTEALFPIACLPIEPCNHSYGLLVNTNRCPQASTEPQPACLPCAQSLPSNAYYPLYNNCSFCCTSEDHKLTISASNEKHCTPLLDSKSCAANFYMEYTNAARCSVITQTCSSCSRTINDESSAIISAGERNNKIESRVLPAFGNGSCEIVCKPGFFKSSNECIPCIAGKYSTQTGMSINETVCQHCDRGTYAANGGSSACESCGKWSIPPSDEKCAKCEIANEDRSRCFLCKSWKTPTRGRTNCTCVQGTYVRVYLNSSTRKRRYACEECPLGSVSSLSNPFLCEYCEPGNVCNIRSSILQECPSGSSKSTENSSCLPCSPGFFSSKKDSTTCTICTAGTYAQFQNSSTCSKCPRNTFSKTLGAYQLSVCKACPSGMMSKEGSSQCDCPALTYFSPPSSCLSCTTCHANATNVAPCPQGSNQDTSVCVCNDGFTGDGYESCQECVDKDQCVCAANEFLSLKM